MNSWHWRDSNRMVSLIYHSSFLDLDYRQMFRRTACIEDQDLTSLCLHRHDRTGSHG